MAIVFAITTFPNAVEVSSASLLLLMSLLVLAHCCCWLPAVVDIPAVSSVPAVAADPAVAVALVLLCYTVVLKNLDYQTIGLVIFSLLLDYRLSDR
jgi:hypothetical protein